MKSRDPDIRRLLADYIVSHQEDFYRLAFSYVKNRDAALDVVQESIVKALSKADTLREIHYDGGGTIPPEPVFGVDIFL